jgi:hypothetical protein
MPTVVVNTDSLPNVVVDDDEQLLVKEAVEKVSYT